MGFRQLTLHDYSFTFLASQRKDLAETLLRRAVFKKSFEVDLNSEKFGYTSCRYPFSNVYISVFCKTGIVRVHEFSGNPVFPRSAAHGIFILGDFRSPIRIFAEMDQPVLFVQHRDPSTQIGNQESVFKLIDVSG